MRSFPGRKLNDVSSCCEKSKIAFIAILSEKYYAPVTDVLHIFENRTKSDIILITQLHTR